MTPTQVQQVLVSMDRLFPRSKLDDAERQLFGERLLRVDITNEQAQAVLEEYRMNFRYGTPDIGELFSLMLKARGEARKVAVGGPVRNLIIDRYRRQTGFPPSVSDEQVAIWVCRNLVSDPAWGERGARTHLYEVLREFIRDEWEVWRIVLRTFPHEGIRQRELERWRRTQAKQAERDAKAKEQAA